MPAITVRHEGALFTARVSVGKESADEGVCYFCRKPAVKKQAVVVLSIVPEGEHEVLEMEVEPALTIGRRILKAYQNGRQCCDAHEAHMDGECSRCVAHLA